MSAPPAVDVDEFRARAREWLEANIPARSGPVLRMHDVTPEQLAADRALQRKVYQAGFAGIAVPSEYGGQGLTRAHQRAWNEEAAGYALPMPGGIASSVTHGIVLPTLLAHASEEQKRSWIPKILSGEQIWVQLLSEPAAGSDLAGLLTRATRDGDVWILNGTKVWTSGAMSADVGICLARTDWDAPKHRGLTWFKVPLRDPRVTVRPIREINGSSEFCEEFLDDVTVGDADVIGEVNGGWPIANFMLAVERGAGADGSSPAAGRSSGRRRRLPSDLVDLATRRGLAHDGASRQLIARAYINDELQGLLTKRITRRLANGTIDATSASFIKLGLGIIQPLRAAAAMELAGRSGLAWGGEGEPGHAAAVNFLNGRIMSIAGGSNQIQRNIIGERLLGLPREPNVDADKPFRDVVRDAVVGPMKLGATVGVRGDDVAGLARHAKRLEDLGVEYLWTGEAYTADAVSTLGYLAAVTTRAQLGSSILPIYSRTPTLLAMTAVGLDKLSGGRFVLGIGASGPQVIEGFHGVPYDRPLARTKEIIEVCRAVWRRERLEHRGSVFQVPLPDGQGTGLGKALKIIDQPVRERIPIHVASLGPKNVELTASLADGWLPLHYWPERASDLWGASLAAGLAHRPPDLPPLDIVAGGLLAIGDDVEHLRDVARPMLALYYGGMGAKGRNYYNDVLRRYGYVREAEEIQDLYLGGRKKDAAKLVPAELVAGMNLVGDKGYIKDRLAAFRESGVTVLNVQPVGPNGSRDIETLAEMLA